MSQSYDVVIIGGGIVGLATAYQVSKRFPKLSIAVLEKEYQVAAHQTGHNSGVLHSGIYYKPNSLKADNCRQGKLRMEEFCEEEGISFEKCGKVIVATHSSELDSLEAIYQRGLANGVNCRRMCREELLEREPHCAGMDSIYVPEAGIVDYKKVCKRLSEILLESDQNWLHYGTRVNGIRRYPRSVMVQTTQGDFKAKFLINCAGLYSDRLTELSGDNVNVKIIPFRGEYFDLKPEARHLCKHLIYPVPDPSFPFLGVHFTRMIDGSVECGPNAVLALAREGYKKWHLNLPELYESLTYGGFLKLASQYWKVGAGEMWRSMSKKAFVNALQRLVPAIAEDHLITAPSGIRAQAVSSDGKMVDDFLIRVRGRVINVCNAPSPAATASLNIGNYVTNHLENLFN